MRIGVVGVGRMGSIHARNLGIMLPAGSLLIHDTDSVAAGRVALDIGGAVCPTVESLVDAADAVVVATPANDRVPVLRAAMTAGIPIFCEKPLAGGLDEAREIADAARRAGARVQVGFQRRFDPEYRMLHQMVGSGAIGQVLMIRGTAFDHEPPADDYQDTAGDIFTDCLIHDIDAARWIAHDDIVSVQADACEVPDPYHPARGVRTGSMILTFAGGGVAVLTASRRDPLGYDHRMEVLGTRLSMAAGLDAGLPLRTVQMSRHHGAPLEVAARSGGVPAFTGFADRFAGAYQAEMRAFLTMVTDGGPSPCGPDDAVRAQEVAAAAAVAAQAGARTPVAVR